MRALWASPKVTLAAMSARSDRLMNLVPYLAGYIVPLEKDAIEIGKVLQICGAF